MSPTTLYGSDPNLIYRLNRDGEVVHRWRGPYEPITNIAFDSEEDILWIGTNISDLIAYDREGNNRGRSIDPQGLGIYGLGWFADDPKGAFLYAMNLPGYGSAQINKINLLTCEMSLVHAFPLIGFYPVSTSRLEPCQGQRLRRNGEADC